MEDIRYLAERCRDILLYRIELVLDEMTRVQLYDLPTDEPVTTDEFLRMIEDCCQTGAQTLAKYAATLRLVRLLHSPTCSQRPQLIVNRTIRLRVDFHKIWATTQIVEQRKLCVYILEVIQNILIFYKFTSRSLTAATARLPGFMSNVAPVHVCGCTRTTFNIIIIAGNDTVPISTWRVSVIFKHGVVILQLIILKIFYKHRTGARLCPSDRYTPLDGIGT